jgi:hypothetical protein
MHRPEREIRASFSDHTIRVYQAFSNEIAEAALQAGKFVSPFRRGRMTWIKPSFTWMMYRAGWATKPGQERVLAIDLSREGFDWALGHSCVSHFEASLHGTPEGWRAMLEESPIRIQWDPERTVALEMLPWRTIQIGIGGDAVDAYVDQWTRRIEDITSLAKAVEGALGRKDAAEAEALRPKEMPYPLLPEIARRIGTG